MKDEVRHLTQRADKHGDELVKLIEQHKHIDRDLNKLTELCDELVRYKHTSEQLDKEMVRVRESMHKLRNGMQVMMSEFHTFKKSKGSDILNHRIDERKKEIDLLGKGLRSDMRSMQEEMHALAVEAHSATENTVILQDIQKRLLALELQMPLLQNSRSWVEKGMLAVMALGMAVLAGKSIIGGAV